MALSPREQKIAIVVGSVVGLYLLNVVALSPFLEKRRTLEDQVAAAQKQVNDATTLNIKHTAALKEWKAINDGGLKSDPAEADYQISFALAEWSRESGLVFSSTKAERSTTDKGFVQSSTNLTVSGPQASIAKLLWRLETATIPVRVNDMTVQAKKPGSDELTVSLSISTLSVDPDAGKTPARARGAVASLGGGRNPS